jgi:hypothetical protein
VVCWHAVARRRRGPEAETGKRQSIEKNRGRGRRPLKTRENRIGGVLRTLALTTTSCGLGCPRGQSESSPSVNRSPWMQLSSRPYVGLTLHMHRRIVGKSAYRRTRRFCARFWRVFC